MYLHLCLCFSFQTPSPLPCQPPGYSGALRRVLQIAENEDYTLLQPWPQGVHVCTWHVHTCSQGLVCALHNHYVCSFINLCNQC